MTGCAILGERADARVCYRPDPGGLPSSMEFTGLIADRGPACRTGKE